MLSKSILKNLQMWSYMASIMKPSGRRTSYIPQNLNMNFVYNFDDFHLATHIECIYGEVTVDHQRYRRYGIRIRAEYEDGISARIALRSKMYTVLDNWCTNTFGRGYKKPGARWHRNYSTVHPQLGRNVYYFRNKSDAAAFKFFWHNAELTDNATKLNGIPF